MNEPMQSPCPKPDSSQWSWGWAKVIRIVVPVIAFGLAIALASLVPATETWADRMEEWGAVGPIVFVLGAAFLMSVMTPKTVVSLTAGAIFGTVLGTIVMLVTSLLAAMANFVIGRWWLAESIDRKLDLMRLEDSSGRGEIFQIARSMAQDAGFGLHLLLRLCPVPTFVVSYTMGACGARWKPFLAAVAVSIIPQTLWVHSGTAAGMVGKADTSGLTWVSIALSLVGGVATSIIVPRLAMKQLRENQTAVDSSKLQRSSC